MTTPKHAQELADTREAERFRRDRTPTRGLSPGERRVFWRLLAACGETNSAELDVEAHCREVARTIVAAQARQGGNR